MPKDATKVVQKFQNAVSGAGGSYADGVASPKRDWLTAYTQAQARMQAGIQAAIAAGKPLKGAQQSGGTANWQSKAQTKGQRNYTAAAADAAAGYAQKVDKVLSAGEAARRAAAALPDTTMEQRMQRAIAAMKAVHDHWGK